MTGPALISLDLSPTGTGVATSDPNRDPTSRISVRTIATGNRRGHERLAHILREIGDEYRYLNPDLAIIEALPRGGGGQASVATLLDLAELHGVVKHWLWARGVPYVLVHPTHIKIYALGKGSGAGTGKDQMILAVERRYGHLAQVATNDEADALALLALALHAYGHPYATVPQTHARALAAVIWPGLPGHHPQTPPAHAARAHVRRREQPPQQEAMLP